jgi:copper resistance protein B
MSRAAIPVLAIVAFSGMSTAQDAGHTHESGHAHVGGDSHESAPAPDAGDHAADCFFDPKVMAHARAMMREEMGGTRFSKIMLNVAEYLPDSNGDGYRWAGQAWFGGDIHRLVLRSEGEGRSDGLDSADVQALYSRAVSRYTDVQFGIRQDIQPHGRAYASIGAQLLVPYWIDVEGSLFLSTHGDLLARAEGSYDIRLLQRLVLQPRVELNLAAQDTAATRTGSGLSTAEAGLRLRYEIRRNFAPYAGVSWERRFGSTADYWKAAGESSHSTNFVAGLRAWF